MTLISDNASLLKKNHLCPLVLLDRKQQNQLETIATNKFTYPKSRELMIKSTLSIPECDLHRKFESLQDTETKEIKVR